MPYVQVSNVILGVNIIGRNVSITSISRAEGVWGSTLRKFLGSKEHQDWLKIDFNAAKTTIVQDCNKEN